MEKLRAETKSKQMKLVTNIEDELKKGQKASVSVNFQ